MFIRIFILYGSKRRKDIRISDIRVFPILYLICLIRQISWSQLQAVKCD